MIQANSRALTGNPHPNIFLNLSTAPPMVQRAGFSPRREEQQYHHHRFPGNHYKVMYAGINSNTSLTHPKCRGPPSLVGQPGMPDPAPRAKGYRPKFTFDDDQLLIDLKEKRNLTWKQITEFFPGRSSGSLEVRYCTKLKTKATVWSEETVSRSCLSCDRLGNHSFENAK